MLVGRQDRLEKRIDEQGEQIEELSDLVPAFKAMKASYDRFTIVVATSAVGIILAAVGVILFGKSIGG